jgi:hypothetical protein
MDHFAAWGRMNVHIAQMHDCFRHREQVAAVSFIDLVRAWA